MTHCVTQTKDICFHGAGIEGAAWSGNLLAHCDQPDDLREAIGGGRDMKKRAKGSLKGKAGHIFKVRTTPHHI